MGISDADTARNPKYFRPVCKKPAHSENACGNHISDTVDLIWTPAFAEVTGCWFKQSLHRT